MFIGVKHIMFHGVFNMSLLLVQCPNCGIELEADEQYLGKKAFCETCGFHFIVQKNEETPPNAAPLIAECQTKGLELNTFSSNSIRRKQFFRFFWGSSIVVLGVGLICCSNNNYGNVQVWIGIAGGFIVGVACIIFGLSYMCCSKQQDIVATKTSKITTVLKKANELKESDITCPIESQQLEIINVISENKSDVKEDREGSYSLKTPFVDDVRTELPVSAASTPPSSLSELLSVDNFENLLKSQVTYSEKKSTKKIEYILPPVSMLSYDDSSKDEDLEEISAIQNDLKTSLENCGICCQLSNYAVGPQVIRFEITLAPGVNVHKIEQNADNIARSLGRSDIRILAPIPGRSAVGIEVPKVKPSSVSLRSMLEAKEWSSGMAEIPVALGKDTSGEPVVIDIATASPILIAGGIRSGKSVCINSLIMSLIFRFRPDELKFIIVDTSGIELMAYNSLPHLLTPVISDNQFHILSALRWITLEMEKRYRFMAAANVKKISEYNNRSIDSDPIFDVCSGENIPDRLPKLLFIIDSFNDTIASDVRKEAEKYIARIVQKGQRAGIYLILVVPRPTVNIISGDIKANFLTSICFKVRSHIDSTVVLNAAGGEKLLGNGDMLCQSFTSRGINRIQGTFTDNSDIWKVMDFISKQAFPQFGKAVIADDDDDLYDKDDLYDDDIPCYTDKVDISESVRKYMRPGDSEAMRRAIEVVIQERKASTNYLQRRFGIGYNRAAELIDQMEERGIVGPPCGSGNKREILVEVSQKKCRCP